MINEYLKTKQLYRAKKKEENKIKALENMCTDTQNDLD